MALKGIKGWFSRKSEAGAVVAQPQFVPDPALSNLCIANIFHVGIPSDVTPTLAYDPFQSLLAIGTLSGLIKLFAGQGLEVVLRDSQSLPIAHLAFHPNAGLLYSARVDDVLVIWDLRTKKPRSEPISLRFRLTYLYATEAVPSYCYLGTKDGDLRVINTEKAVVTSFCLSLVSLSVESSAPAAVFFLKLHPSDPSTILIGYEGRPALIWSLKSAKCLRSLSYDSHINALDWTNDGTEIVAGLRDGNLAFWTYGGKETEPKKLMRVHSDLTEVNVSAVEKVICTHNGILVYGGQPFSKEGSLSFLAFSEGTVRIALPAEPYCVVSAPVIESGTVRERAFVLTENCGLFSVGFAPLTEKPIYFPSVIGPGKVVKSCLITVASEGNSVIDFVEGFNPLCDSTLTGGVLTETFTDCFGVLLTAHDDALIHFWKVSKQKLVLLASISMQPASDFPYGNNQNLTFFPAFPGKTITLLSVYLPERLIVIGDNSGVLTVQKAVLSGFQEQFSAKVTPAAVLKAAYCAGEQLRVICGDVTACVSIANLASGEVRDVANFSEGKKGRQNVLISDIVAFPDMALAAVGVSNGAVFLVDLVSCEVVHSLTSLNSDLTSETPKRSEFGIVQMLSVIPLPSVLLVCYEKIGFTVSLPEAKTTAGVSWPSPIFSAAINLFNTQAYLTTLDRSGTLSLWSLPDLVQKWKSDTMLPLDLEKAQHFMMAMDGHFFIDSAGTELARGWLTFQGGEDEDTIQLFTPGIDSSLYKPPPKRKSLFGIRFSTEPNPSSLFEKPPKRCTAKDPDSVPSGPGELHSELNRASTAVAERGERLSRLEQQMSDMAEQAKSLAEMVEKHNREQASKKWWQF